MGASDPGLLPEPIRRMVEAEVRGESLRWVDQPIPGRMTRQTWAMVLFAIPWTAFALFWMWSAAAMTGPTSSGQAQVFPLFGVPFVLVGLGLFSSPIWARLAAKRTVYLVTDRRAVVLRGRWLGGVNVRSFEPEKLRDLTRNQRADGSGDLVFGQDVRVGNRGSTQTIDYGFLAVRDVRGAEEYVAALARHAPRV